MGRGPKSRSTVSAVVEAPRVERPTWGPAATVLEAQHCVALRSSCLAAVLAAPASKVRRERLELHGDLVKAVRKGDLFCRGILGAAAWHQRCPKKCPHPLPSTPFQAWSTAGSELQLGIR